MKTKAAKQIFDFLPGIWKIARNVVSQVSYENIQASGYGAFIVSTNDPNLILYSEKVTICKLDPNASNLNASNFGTQKYKYKYDITTSSISKYFNDGRFFYTMNISDYKIDAEHLCIRDKYIPNYVFGEGRFSLIYSVDGPSKCYKIITEYTKISTEDVTILGITIENGEIV